MRQNFLPSDIDTPLVLTKTSKLSGTTTNTICLIDEQFLLAGQNGFLYSVSAEDIDDNADIKISDGISVTPTFMNKKFYVSSEKGKKALIQYDFTRRKEMPLEGFAYSTASPIVWQRKIYYASLDGTLTCINSETLDTEWKSELAGKIIRSPAFDGERIYVITQNGLLRSFTPEKGDILWSRHFKESFYISPLSTDRALYIADFKGTIYMIDKSSGNVIKKQNTGKSILTALSTDGENILAITTDAVLRLYDSSLENLIWQQKLDAPVRVPALITNNMVLAGTVQKSFYLLDLKHGDILQTIKLKGRPSSTPVPYKGKIVMGMEYEKLLEFQVKK
jgi:outer membrane protein assembly factor BamB